MSRVATVLAAIAAADEAERAGDYQRAAELLAQAERGILPIEGRTVDGRHVAAVDAYSRTLVIPSSRVKA